MLIDTTLVTHYGHFVLSAKFLTAAIVCSDELTKDTLFLRLTRITK